MADFHVPDMTCGGCVRAITKAVQRADADATIAADVPTHSVHIESKLAESRLAAVLREAGFTPEPAA